jgi:glycyl-tRNA synthetase beta chain
MVAFLLEVGTEELPASFVASALEQWRERVPASLAAAELHPTQVAVYGTPRRLAVLLEGLPEKQADRQEDVKGPPAGAAFKNGEPTPAAAGFARKQGVDLAALEVRPTDKGDFVFVKQQRVGRPTAEILQELIPDWINGLEGKRFMRWGAGELRFSRPIRWLVALLDDQVLPLELSTGDETLVSGRISQAHRVLHPEPVTLARATDYVSSLEQAFVLVDPARREQRIREQTAALAGAAGGVAEMPAELVEEVVHLVEWPTAVVGHFEDSFLSLPPEVSTMVMISHQRYFPIYKADAPHNPAAIDARADLLPSFVTISNGDPAKSELIASGNARVIRARLADGEYFYTTDCQHPLESYLPKLEVVTFQEQLGSLRAKVDRIGAIAHRLSDQLTLNGEDRLLVQRAAQLCKADLVTQMVYEFPELQGVMGQKYALVSGESPAVATAMLEHYLPRGAGDQLPSTRIGQVVGLADRLDTLVSIFGLGLLPTGSSDPFALRRAANAVLNITWTAQLPINLAALLGQITSDFQQSFPEAPSQLELLRQQLSDFFVQRIRTLLQEEQGIDYDLVNAVLGEADTEAAQRALDDLLDIRQRAHFLQALRNDGRLEQIYAVVNRASRLASKGSLAGKVLDPAQEVDPSRFEKSSEQSFLDSLTKLAPLAQAAQQSLDYEPLVNALAEVAPTLAEFFDGDNSVLVMDPDPEIQRNRLNLLGLLRNQARVLADFGAIVKGD